MKHHHTTTQPAKATAPKAVAKSAAQPAASPSTDAKDEFVRQAAYYYYEARGCVGGNELDDWLRAEAEFERMRVDDAADAPPGSAAH